MKKVTTLLFTFFFAITIIAQPVIQWQKKLGGTKQDQVQAVKQTKDGGYITLGLSLSNDGDVTGHHGSTSTYDIWVVKMDPAGEIEWQKSLGGSDYDYAFDIQQTNDEGYVFAASTRSYDGNITLNHGGSDCWVVKLDKNGNIIWDKSFGTGWDERGKSVQRTKDGGYLVGGEDELSQLKAVIWFQGTPIPTMAM